MTIATPLPLLWLLVSCRLSPTAALAAGWEHGVRTIPSMPEDSTSLLQHEVHLGGRSGSFPKLARGLHHPAAAGSEASADAKLDVELKKMLTFVRHGFWSQKYPPLGRCGTSNLRELSTNLGIWRSEHPNKDGYCHFQNFAFWLNGYGKALQDYTVFNRGQRVWSTNQLFCNYLGQSRGPERNVTFEDGVMTFKHLDHCIDAVDDPYCYSIGWLKGQRLDGVNMSDGDAWRAKGYEECERIQREFIFTDEEVTVGRHVYGMSICLEHGLLNAMGKARPLTHRMYNEWVYTKCLLGNGHASSEMAYCYYKGCVLPDGKIGHNAECGYNER